MVGAKDIFSLGVVFFQLLAARVPRPGPDAVAGIFQASRFRVGTRGHRDSHASDVYLS